jgi:glycerol-3-phosphate dehydrogenase
VAFDVAIVGAGVVGCAIARELSRYELDAVVLEETTDFGDGASKGNTATLCCGYDTPAGTLERALVVRGYGRYLSEGPALGLPVELTGAVMVAWDDAQAETVAREVRRSIAEGFADTALLEPDALYARVPHLGRGAVCALWQPSEGIVDPFSTVYAYLLDAVENGVVYRSMSPVTAARYDGRWTLATPLGDVRAKLVVNCAGLNGDTVDAYAGYEDFRIRPRRGQYLVFDRLAGGLLDVIVKQTPTPSSRGTYVAPTIFGNVLVGPTAEEVKDQRDRRVTKDGIAQLMGDAAKVLPALLDHGVVTTYAGMRPATGQSDYVLVPRPDRRWITVGGIRSTGLSAALGIAEHVVGLAIPEMLDARRKRHIRPVRVPSMRAGDPRPWESSDDPAYREMVCHCERVSVGAVRDALGSPLPPRSLKALQRRTRVMLGRCQGFYCGSRVRRMLETGGSDAPR